MKDCESCVHEHLSPMSDTCRECGIAMLNYEERKPMTNADRIRGMSDEGIEDWYWWMHKEMMRYTDSRIFVHDWLKSPVEESHGETD